MTGRRLAHGDPYGEGDLLDDVRRIPGPVGSGEVRRLLSSTAHPFQGSPCRCHDPVMSRGNLGVLGYGTDLRSSSAVLVRQGEGRLC